MAFTDCYSSLTYQPLKRWLFASKQHTQFPSLKTEISYTVNDSFRGDMPLTPQLPYPLVWRPLPCGWCAQLIFWERAAKSEMAEWESQFMPAAEIELGRISSCVRKSWRADVIRPTPLVRLRNYKHNAAVYVLLPWTAKKCAKRKHYNYFVSRRRAEVQ